MGRETLRGQYNEIVGFLETMPGSGRVKLTDRHSKAVGWYDPERDATIDQSGRVVARGDRLLSLLPAGRR